MHLKTSRLPLYALLAASLILFTACPGPEPPEPPVPVDTHADGLYILNEGTFQHNNSTITYYNFETGAITEDIFLEANHRGLGDTGNDLQRYGSKLYAVVNNSNRLEVMNFEDAKSIKSINLDGKQPRYICFYGSKAYVSCFDGDVVRIDTATLEVDGTVRCGRNPEGICVCNHKLYVANSGGLDNPNYDNTVSVIDPTTFTVTNTVTVGINPSVVANYNDRYVILVSRGDYMNVPYKLLKIDVARSSRSGCATPPTGRGISSRRACPWRCGCNTKSCLRGSRATSSSRRTWSTPLRSPMDPLARCCPARHWSLARRSGCRP